MAAPRFPPPASAAALLLFIYMLRPASPDVASDKTGCTDQLVGLSTCLPYAQGEGNSPTPDCCSGLKSVLAKRPKCLCVLIKDSNDPQFGVKINVSLAISLPNRCGAAANISLCPKLLKLPPNSEDAQVFKQFGIGVADVRNTTAKGSLESGSGSSSGSASVLWGGVVVGNLLMIVVVELLLILDG